MYPSPQAPVPGAAPGSGPSSPGASAAPSRNARRRRRAETLAGLLLSLCLSAAAGAFPGTHWEQAARRQGIDPLLLHAVALAESAFRRAPRQVSPWPYAIRNGSESVYPPSRAAAQLRLGQLLASTSPRQLDIGLMQINLHWHGRRVTSSEQLLDAAVNLRLGAEILAAAMRTAPADPVLGVGRYHSWRESRARWYGRKVLAIYRNLLLETKERI